MIQLCSNLRCQIVFNSNTRPDQIGGLSKQTLLSVRVSHGQNAATIRTRYAPHSFTGSGEEWGWDELMQYV